MISSKLYIYKSEQRAKLLAIQLLNINLAKKNTLLGKKPISKNKP